ncbi:MAG TPA: hypothetical protein VK550_12365 [Polyangiaceae bacterium]|nr:hypothetical protein [Polyangiaceae bacterium]
MPQFMAKGQRVRVRDAHNLKGEVVSVWDDGNVAEVRFDLHPDATHRYHVEDLEPEDDACGCVFCRGPRT